MGLNVKSLALEMLHGCPVDCATARVGGLPLLPVEIGWPLNVDGKKMFLVTSLPAEFLDRYLGRKLASGMVVSVFSTYSAEDYFLDKVTVNGDVEDYKNVVNRYTKVVVHLVGQGRRDGPFIPSREISVSAEVPASHQGSKIGGAPGFLQGNNGLPIRESDFVMQIYSSDVSDEYPDILGLSDSVGYLYLGTNNVGCFFSQCT